MKKLVYIISLPIILMVLVNETSPESTFDFEKERCTRACHNQGCSHYSMKESNIWHILYQTNIYYLAHNPLDFSYKLTNILLYVVVVPILLLVLIWGLIRK